MPLDDKDERIYVEDAITHAIVTFANGYWNHIEKQYPHVNDGDVCDYLKGRDFAIQVLAPQGRGIVSNRMNLRMNPHAKKDRIPNGLVAQLSATAAERDRLKEVNAELVEALRRAQIAMGSLASLETFKAVRLALAHADFLAMKDSKS